LLTQWVYKNCENHAEAGQWLLLQYIASDHVKPIKEL